MTSAKLRLAVIGLACLGMALAAAPAGATTIFVHPFVKSFDATGSKSAEGETGPFSNVDHIAIDQVTGNVYVLDLTLGTLDKFDSQGNPVAFSALGAGVNSIRVEGLGAEASVAVNNSGGGSQGVIYVAGGNQPAHAFAPSGTELAGNFPLTPTGETCGAATDPEGNFWWATYGIGAIGYSSAGFPLGKTVDPEAGICNITINQAKPPSPTSGWFYIAGYGGGTMYAFNAEGELKNQWEAGESRAWAVDPGNGSIYVDNYQHVTEWAPSATGTPGAAISIFGDPDPAHGLESGINCSQGIAVDGTTHRIFVGDCGKVDIFGPGEAKQTPTVTADDPDVTTVSAILRGHASTDEGGDTTGCRFEYGFDTGYGQTIACDSPSGPIHNADGEVEVRSKQLTQLEPGTVYHFRLVVSGVNGESASADRTFKPQGPPVVSGVFTSDVTIDSARLNATIDPGGSDTRYRFEWGPTAAYGNSIPVPDFKVVDNHHTVTISEVLHGLQPGSTYHYRLLASNANGSDESDDHFLSTFTEETEDPNCPNAQARRQTRTTLLADCRAYELVSAADAGGYDVQSDLIPGQVTLPAAPRASDQVLYSLHHGKIPGTTGPTNLGLDPYVATRGAGGWTTRYVGIPADGPPATAPFGSPLAQADEGLSAFAFGGNNICTPCFADGKTGIPVRAPGGSLVQGMAGSLDPGPAATPGGYVGRELSADGTHLVFGSTSKFEPDGNSNGDLTIYDRNLVSGVTLVASKTTGGATMTGAGIGELDVSADGSRVLFGQAAAPDDSAGNHYWHLYMNIGGSSSSVSLTPGATDGALYDGMTADGSRVFFTSADKLLGSDTDASPDIYEADIAAGGGVTLTLVSTGSGAAGNTDACNPTANWNAVGEKAANCGAVAFSGGSGVAAGDGTIFFLSPEKLDGPGTQDAPNLYVRRPGAAPHLVGTLDPEDLTVKHAVRDNEAHSFENFQVTPSGDYGAFASAASLTGFPNEGDSEIYRYDAVSAQLDCASCAPTRAAPAADTSLNVFGLNLTDAGAVFFTGPDQLVLRDSNKRLDAYEWKNGTPQLISAGNGATDSGLVSVSADGVNAYFFTREVLVPEDQNGTSMKIYDARELGGFPKDPPLLPCQASDECHGPGSIAAPPPDIGTFKGTGGNLKATEPSRKKHKPKKHRKHRHKRHQHDSRAGGARR
jgi:hypothetical protein